MILAMMESDINSCKSSCALESLPPAERDGRRLGHPAGRRSAQGFPGEAACSRPGLHRHLPMDRDREPLPALRCGGAKTFAKINNLRRDDFREFSFDTFAAK